MIARTRSRLGRLSLYQRIAIGNSVIIVLGAVVGTLLTHYMADQAATGWLILLFAGIGTALSVALNCLIVRAALQPMSDLRRLVEAEERVRVAAGDGQWVEADPDTRQLAQALRSLVRELEARNRELQALSERAINAQEEERKRIARSLHDDTGQMLSTLIIALERLEQRPPAATEVFNERLAAARQLAQSALQELRQIIHGLRPTILDDLGLGAAIRWYARTHLESKGVRVLCELPEDELQLPPAYTTTLFRIAQEAVNNITRHAGAKNVQIRLEKQRNSVCLWVTDDGRGFDVAKASERAVPAQRLGLLGMQERAELVGGNVVVDAMPGQGTRLQICLPLAAMEEANEENAYLVGR